jgi:hypothetical protein
MMMINIFASVWTRNQSIWVKFRVIFIISTHQRMRCHLNGASKTTCSRDINKLTCVIRKTTVRSSVAHGNLRTPIWAFSRDVPFKTQLINNHLLRYKNEIRGMVHPCVIDSPNLPRYTRVKVTLVARPLLTPVAQICAVRTWCIHEQNLFLFSNISSHRKRLLLFVKHLAIRIPTRKY